MTYGSLGRKSWIVMELASPIMFTYTFLTSPFSAENSLSRPPTAPQLILAALYLIHYTNRALISPLRSPTRSKAHIVVPFAGLLFNIPNGSLNGTYLSSPAARAYLSPSRAFSSPIFYAGLFLWAIGFAGNIIHDEILSNIRRKADSKGKGKQSESQSDGGAARKPHYAIPHGLLYKYVSFPNYFCEWVEWFGFALAAAPFPITSLSQLSLQNISWLFSARSILEFSVASPSSFAPMLTPPWIFFLNEIVTMFPRAYMGHQWYKEKFRDAFPKERKIVVPFVL